MEKSRIESVLFKTFESHMDPVGILVIAEFDSVRCGVGLKKFFATKNVGLDFVFYFDEK